MSSLFARALAGAGAGIASIASRYVDEEIARNKAQALADIEVASKKRMDDYELSPERQAKLRENKRQDVLTTGAAARENEVAGLNDANLQGAREALKDREAAGETRRKITGRKTEITELLPDEIAAKNRTLEGTSDAEAAAAGKKKRAESENTAYDLSPGQERYIGQDRMASNGRATPQEVQDKLFREGLKSSGKGAGAALDKMSEAGKLQLQGIEKRDAALQGLIDKGLAEGTLSEKPTDKDGKPSPGYEQLQSVLRQRQTLHVSRQRLLAAEGVIDGDDDAQRLLKMGATRAELEASVQQAKQIGGDYAADFITAIQPTLDKAKAADANGAKSPVGKPESQARAQAAAQGGPSVQEMIEADKRAQSSGGVVNRDEQQRRLANIAKARSDPDLIALDQQAQQFLKAGKAAQANAAIAKANELRKQRYGY